jgi:hypothetical protein
MLLDINAEKAVVDREAWLSTGPMRLTETWKGNQYQELSMLPKHYFIPNHFERPEMLARDICLRSSFWGATSKKLRRSPFAYLRQSK